MKWFVVDSGTRESILRISSALYAMLALLAPIPALAVGAMVMQRSGVSSAIWAQQLAAGLILTALCAGTRAAPRIPLRGGSWGWAIVGCVALLLLIASLAHPGVEGVRRWVSLGPLQLHAAFVALPVLLVVFGEILRRDLFRNVAWLMPCATAIAAGVLVLQPDASQASAFGLAVFALVFRRRLALVSGGVAAGLVILCAVAAWTWPDPLAAVPHVEGIVSLAANLSTVWLATSLLALGVLLIPFITPAVSGSERRRESLALATYFGTVCIMPFVGPYPVPLLGYGLSPVLGYYAALGWLILRNTNVDARRLPEGQHARAA